MPYNLERLEQFLPSFLRNFYKYINRQNLNFQNEALSPAERAMPHGTPNMVKLATDLNTVGLIP